MDRLNPRTSLDPDPLLTANSDDRVPTQKAIKTYVSARSIHVIASLNFASIASNSTGTQTVTVTGATVSSGVTLGAPSTIEAGLIWCGFVSAADTVTIRLHNASGGAIDPALATWHVIVEATH